MPDAVVVELDRQLGALDAERRKQLASSAYGSTVGIGCCIQPKMIRAASPAPAHGTMPLPVSSRISSSCSGAARTNAVPSVGWPANGISLRRREDADARVPAALRPAGRTLSRTGSSRGRAAASVRLDVARVGEDGERVARERRVGEDVGDDVAEVHDPLYAGGRGTARPPASSCFGATRLRRLGPAPLAGTDEPGSEDQEHEPACQERPLRPGSR